MYRAMGAWALFLCAAHAAYAGCEALELIGRGEMRAGAGREIPLYLAIPDTLGPIAVRPFLMAPPEKAKAALAGSDWSAHPLSKPDVHLLKALRDWTEGRQMEAGEAMAALLPKASPLSKSVLRADKALLLYSAGFTDDAEKEWNELAGSNGACKDAARKNLYSFYLDRRKTEKAQALCDRILALEPKDRWANDAKAYLVRLAVSDEDWERFLKEKSDGRDSLFEMQIAYGRLLKSQGRFEEAKRYYSRGLEGAPRNGPAWLDLAEVHYRLGLPFLAQTCLMKSFEAGIRDPYVFELLGRVLVDLTRYAAKGEEMRALGWGIDSLWAERCWRMAEGNLESGFPHDLQSRSMAQLLYHLYCHNRKTDAARELRKGFWFHFTGPEIPREAWLHPPVDTSESPCLAPETSGCRTGGNLLLAVRLGFVAHPLAAAVFATDFFEPF